MHKHMPQMTGTAENLKRCDFFPKAAFSWGPSQHFDIQERRGCGQASWKSPPRRHLGILGPASCSRAGRRGRVTDREQFPQMLPAGREVQPHWRWDDPSHHANSCVLCREKRCAALG